MSQSMEEVKKIEKWRLEAEAEFRKKISAYSRIVRWFSQNIVSVAIGAIIVLIIGYGWELTQRPIEKRKTRTDVLYEGQYRIGQLIALFEKQSSESINEKSPILSKYENYLSDPFGPSPFGMDPNLKQVPDLRLSSVYLNNGGDQEIADELNRIFGDARTFLLQRLNQPKSSKSSIVIVGKLRRLRIMLFLTKDLQRIVPMTEKDVSDSKKEIEDINDKIGSS